MVIYHMHSGGISRYSSRSSPYLGHQTLDTNQAWVISVKALLPTHTVSNSLSGYLQSSNCGVGIAEQVSVLDWLSLRCAAIITLHVSNHSWCLQARFFNTLASSVDRDVNVGPVG